MNFSSKNKAALADHLGETGLGGFAPMRLQKFLARAGVASRRHSEELISSGRIQVNGCVVQEMGVKIDPYADEVRLDGETVSLGEKPVTIMLNKPAGFITTMEDDRGRPCVAELAPTDKYPGLFPVGRLDGETTGLLLFTNDGQLGYGLTHPKHHVVKTYVAKVKGRANAKQVGMLREGVQIHGGITAPAKVRILREEKQGSVLEIKIHEGRNRQVRRMCSAVNLPVLQLERVAIGPLTLGRLEQGSWRLVTQEELDGLIKAIG